MYLDNPDDNAGFTVKNIQGDKFTFSAKLAPGGMSVFDVIWN